RSEGSASPRNRSSCQPLVRVGLLLAVLLEAASAPGRSTHAPNASTRTYVGVSDRSTQDEDLPGRGGQRSSGVLSRPYADGVLHTVTRPRDKGAITVGVAVLPAGEDR